MMVAPVTVTMALSPLDGLPGFASTRMVPRKFPTGTTDVMRPAMPAGVEGSTGDLAEVPQALSVDQVTTSSNDADIRRIRRWRGRRLRIMVVYFHNSVTALSGHPFTRSSSLDSP